MISTILINNNASKLIKMTIHAAANTRTFTPYKMTRDQRKYLRARANVKVVESLGADAQLMLSPDSKKEYKTNKAIVATYEGMGLFATPKKKTAIVSSIPPSAGRRNDQKTLEADDEWFSTKTSPAQGKKKQNEMDDAMTSANESPNTSKVFMMLFLLSVAFNAFQAIIILALLVRA